MKRKYSLSIKKSNKKRKLNIQTKFNELPCEVFGEIISYYCINLTDIFNLLILSKTINSHFEQDWLWRQIAHHVTIENRWIHCVPVDLHEEKITKTLEILETKERQNDLKNKIKTRNENFKPFLKDLLENYCYVCQTTPIVNIEIDPSENPIQNNKIKNNNHDNHTFDLYDSEYDSEESEEEQFMYMETLNISKSTKTSSRAIPYKGYQTLNICGDCYRWSRMSKGTCKKSFFVSDIESEHLPHHEKTNPYGYKNLPMKVFNLKNVCIFGFKKFKDGYMEEFQKRTMKREKWRIKYEEVKKERSEKIKSALKSKNIAYNEDSSILKLYINQRTKNTLEETVQQMEKMEFLNTKTTYKKCFYGMIYGNSKNKTYEDQKTLNARAEEQAMEKWMETNSKRYFVLPFLLKKYANKTTI